MHDHNDNKNGRHNGMMWMMIPCLLLLGVILLGGGNLSSGGYLWPILIGVFVVAHIWMMFRGRSGHNHSDSEEKQDEDSEKQNNKNNEHKHGGCCH